MPDSNHSCSLPWTGGTLPIVFGESDMPGPEATLERTICEEAKLDGWIVYKLKFIDCRGAPDRFFGKNGRALFIEFKAPGKKPNLQQRKRHRELLNDFGMEVHWCDDLFNARHLLGIGDDGL